MPSSEEATHTDRSTGRCYLGARPDSTLVGLATSPPDAVRRRKSVFYPGLTMR